MNNSPPFPPQNPPKSGRLRRLDRMLNHKLMKRSGCELIVVNHGTTYITLYKDGCSVLVFSSTGKEGISCFDFYKGVPS